MKQRAARICETYRSRRLSCLLVGQLHASKTEKKSHENQKSMMIYPKRNHGSALSLVLLLTRHRDTSGCMYELGCFCGTRHCATTSQSNVRSTCAEIIFRFNQNGYHEISQYCTLVCQWPVLYALP